MNPVSDPRCSIRLDRCPAFLYKDTSCQAETARPSRFFALPAPAADGLWASEAHPATPHFSLSKDVTP